MRRGVLLSLPSPRGLTAADHTGLERAAAATGVRIERLLGRHCREAAILTINGRQLWIERDDTSLLARTACSGRFLARGADVGELLAAVRAARFAAVTTGLNGIVLSSAHPYRAPANLLGAGE